MLWYFLYCYILLSILYHGKAKELVTKSFKNIFIFYYNTPMLWQHSDTPVLLLCTGNTLIFLHQSYTPAILLSPCINPIHRLYSYSPSLFLYCSRYYKKREAFPPLFKSYSSVPLSCIALNAADKPDNPFGSSKISSGLNGSLTSWVRLSETSTLSSLSVESLTFL